MPIDRVFIQTGSPLPIAAAVVGEPHKGSDGDEYLILEFSFEGRKLSQTAIRPKAYAELRESGLLGVDRPLGLLVDMSPEGGARAILGLILPPAEDDDPFEDGEETEGLEAEDEGEAFDEGHGDFAFQASEERHRLFVIGRILRGPKERRHPGDLQEEAYDMMREVLGPHRVRTPEEQAVDDLLNSL